MLATLAPSAVVEFRLVRRLCTHTVKESISGSPVYTHGHFCVEPCVTCFVPGYLIVTPHLPAASLSELERDALAYARGSHSSDRSCYSPRACVLRPFCRGDALCSFSSFPPVGVASVAVCCRKSSRS